MILSSSIRRLAALAAAFGIVLQALWPAIAQARPADSISVPICSIDGTRHEIQLPVGSTTDGSEHCKLCVLGLDKLVVALDSQFSLGHRENEKCIAVEHQSYKPATDLLARPRAPPHAS